MSGKYGARQPEIDIEEAECLKAAGLSWRQVAAELSRQKNRVPPFRSESVSTAVSVARKKRRT